MNFNKHLNLEGKHAFLSPSKYHWINYDIEKLRSSYIRHLAVQRGTDLHELACRCIRLGITLPKNNNALSMYVNDAIEYKMTPEQPLYYSKNCFGTADTISFRNNELRIHDFKSGETKTHIEQLEIYAAIFCLEYEIYPRDLDLIELRIYQRGKILKMNPDPERIIEIMSIIVRSDNEIEQLRNEGEGV